MIYFPNAKINIGLHVTGKRNDGYHNIETVFYPVGLTDILEVLPLNGYNENTIRNTGNRLDVIPSENLCIKAWSELNKSRPLGHVQIHLHKIIPSGAGLGGGSSNAAFVLKALNDIFNLKMSPFELSSVSGKIGSDCPFFIHNRPLYACGKGEIFETTGVDLTGVNILILHPGISINTTWAYSRLNITRHKEPLKELINTHPGNWADRIINDFEPSVFHAYPLVRKVKEKLLEEGAFYASMTGSGSAVYGLFDYDVETGTLEKEFPGIYIWKGVL